MSDSSNMLNDLVGLYNDLLAMLGVKAQADANLLAAQAEVQAAQVVKASAEADLQAQHNERQRREDEIARLQNELITHNMGIPAYEAVVNNATTALSVKEGSVIDAQNAAAQANTNYNNKLQEVNDLKARIKAEVDDDFPT